MQGAARLLVVTHRSQPSAMCMCAHTDMHTHTHMFTYTHMSTASVRSSWESRTSVENTAIAEGRDELRKKGLSEDAISRVKTGRFFLLGKVTSLREENYRL